MVREIKTTLAIDGEKAFKKTLAEASREMAVMNADLKAMAAEFSATDDAQRYYAERSDTLNRKVKQQEEIVEALTRAVRESADVHGSAAKQTDEYRIKLSNATAKLFDMRREAEQANRDLEDLGRDSVKIGRQIEQGIGDAAEDTSDKLDGMIAKVAKDVNALKGSVGFQTAIEITGFVKELTSGAEEFVRASSEYRRDMSFLEQNAKTYKQDFTAVKGLMFEMSSVSGEIGGSIEALSNLMAAGYGGANLAAAVDALGGAVVRFPDTLKFESLADGLQETLATGKATGQYAELLERLGVSLADFDKALAENKSDADHREIALAYLNNYGLGAGYKSYLDAYKSRIEAEIANYELEDAKAALGEEIEPWTTWKTDVKTSLFQGLANLVRGLKGEEIEKPTAIDVSGQLEIIEGEIKRLRKYGVGWETINEVLDKEVKKLSELSKSEIDPSITAEELNKYFETETWIKRKEDQVFTIENILKQLIPSAGAETLPTTELQEYGYGAWKEVENGIMQASESNAAVDAAIKTALAEMQAEDVVNQAKVSGKNLMIAFGNGIAEGVSIPINNVANMVNQINAMLSQIAAPAFGLGWSGVTGGNIYLYNQQKTISNTISKTIGAGVQTKMLIK